MMVAVAVELRQSQPSLCVGDACDSENWRPSTRDERNSTQATSQFLGGAALLYRLKIAVAWLTATKGFDSNTSLPPAAHGCQLNPTRPSPSDGVPLCECRSSLFGR